jgi:hypothetical protein
VDEHDETEEAAAMTAIGPELARCSALADELARLLLPARLFS